VFVRSLSTRNYSTDAVMKQATLTSVYNAEKAVLSKKNEVVKSCWEEDDFKSLGLDKYLVDVDVVTGAKKNVRIFYNFIQDWEEETIYSKSHLSEVQLRNKYGGIKYYDVDNDFGRFETRTIDINKLAWQNKKEDKCYYVVGRVDRLSDEHPLKEEVWPIVPDLHFSIRTYYRKNPDPYVELITESAYKGKTEEAEDYEIIDEWISNGGYFTKKKKRERRNDKVKPKAAAPEIPKKVPKIAKKAKAKPKSAKKRVADDITSSENEEDELPNRLPPKTLTITTNTSSDDDANEESE
jgi:hypothetical protein